MAGSMLNRVAAGARHVDLGGPNVRECLTKHGAWRYYGTRSRYHRMLTGDTIRADLRCQVRLLLSVP